MLRPFPKVGDNLNIIPEQIDGEASVIVPIEGLIEGDLAEVTWNGTRFLAPIHLDTRIGHFYCPEKAFLVRL